VLYDVEKTMIRQRIQNIKEKFDDKENYYDDIRCIEAGD